MSLTKADLVTSISKNTDRYKPESTKALETIFELIKQSLESGEDVLISSFGKFCVKEKNQRRGRNPATNNEMILESRRVVTFRCSIALRKRINGEG